MTDKTNNKKVKNFRHLSEKATHAFQEQKFLRAKKLLIMSLEAQIEFVRYQNFESLAQNELFCDFVEEFDLSMAVLHSCTAADESILE